MEIKRKNIPAVLAAVDQWIVWKTVTRKDRPTKVLYQMNGIEAKSNDPKTWTTLDAALARYDAGGYEGPGFVFSHYDPFVGIDLDGCRDPETGKIADWAREVILKLDTYAEVSPSETGVKLWVCGKSPFDTGKKQELPNQEKVSDKQPGIEIYEHGRYFAVTGWRLSGQPHEPQERDLHWLRETFWPLPDPPLAHGKPAATSVVDRARRYLATLPEAVSGNGGHDQTFHAACVLVCGFGLDESEATGLMREYNVRCQPPWSEKELLHKVQDAAKQPGDRNYLRDAEQSDWKKIKVPDYQQQVDSRAKRVTSLEKATDSYLKQMMEGRCDLVSLGLPEVDYALGGGVAAGEMVLVAARPSHGKSAVALQCIHSATADGRAALIISEEMSPLALAKRTIQFATEIPEKKWRDDEEAVRHDLANHFEKRMLCRVVESCGTAAAAASEIVQATRDTDIKIAAVDYAQLLDAPGRSEYEKVTEVCKTLRRVTNETGVVLLLLCQLNRAIESRPNFIPKLSDLRGAGQLEQDADVVLFLCWPHRLDENRNPKEFLVFVAKNRNRPINKPVVRCEFDPSRQMVRSEEGATRYPEFEEHEREWWE